MLVRVLVSEADFSLDAEMFRMKSELGQAETGAMASFVGLVRHDGTKGGVNAMELEHYPGMTEKSLTDIATAASERWSLQAATIIHRVGRLLPGDQIVLVLTASAHRKDALSACDFIMDYLKTRAPFWKKEHRDAGSVWVAARATDEVAAASWEKPSKPIKKTPERP